MNKSIFGRLFWTNIIVITLVFISVSAVLTIFLNNYIMMNQYRSIMKVRSTIEYRTVYLLVQNQDVRAKNSYRQILDGWSEFLNAEIIITNTDGVVTEDTGNNITHVPKEYISQINNGDIVRSTGHFDGQYKNKVYTVGIPVYYNGNIIAAMYFNTFLPVLNKMVVNIIFLFLVASTLTLLVAFGLVYRQSLKISRPIKNINNAAMDIAAGNFSERVKVESCDEIGQLASTFNFMANSLEKLEDMRNRFISDVSHELRTPMTSISGFVEGIIDGTIPPEKEKEYLQIVLDESVRLTKLVNDLLEMSKMSDSQYKLDIKEFDINELIRLCIISLEKKITDAQLDLDVDFSKDSINVLADKDAIKRVILNLMDNAIKFSYKNTTIKIKSEIKNNKVQITIGNYGDGIKKEELSHIFERFYKTDKSRTTEKKGAGLGLSFVKNILVLHKQSIWVESQEQTNDGDAKYTTFSFTLEKA